MAGQDRAWHIHRQAQGSAGQIGRTKACERQHCTPPSQVSHKAGQGRAGQGRAGQGRAERGGAGQGRAGQGRAGAEGTTESTKQGREQSIRQGRGQGRGHRSIPGCHRRLQGQ